MSHGGMGEKANAWFANSPTGRDGRVSYSSSRRR